MAAPSFYLPPPPIIVSLHHEMFSISPAACMYVCSFIQSPFSFLEPINAYLPGARNQTPKITQNKKLLIMIRYMTNPVFLFSFLTAICRNFEEINVKVNPFGLCFLSFFTSLFPSLPPTNY